VLTFGAGFVHAESASRDVPNGTRAGATTGSDASVQAGPGEPGPQSASDAPHNVPDLALSPSQKQVIYESIRNQSAKKSAQPVGFRSAIGSLVTEVIEVSALPKTIVELMPKIENYGYAFVANQVLIVDPKSKVVVEVISE
jgi:hypothetical protein